MIINLDLYDEHYHQGDKFKDNWQEGIKLLPFNSNPTSAFDSKCGLLGIVGEFIRSMVNDGTIPISDFTKDAQEPVYEYLTGEAEMNESEAKEYTRMLKDILLVNGNLNITDSAFLKYLPIVPNDEGFSKKEITKYKSGQEKIANYLYSMLPSGFNKQQGETKPQNLFVDILKQSLHHIETENDEGTKDYQALGFIKDSFVSDITWMLSQEETVKVKYFPLFLYFYACYSVTQTIAHLSSNETTPITGPKPFYCILNSEKASVNHEAVTKGWSSNIPKSLLDKLFGKSQALDIVNCVLGGNIGFYPEVYSKLNETDFSENQPLCEELLRRYQEEKMSLLNPRKSENFSYTAIDVTVNSYNEFLRKLEYLCTNLQSGSYISRMRKKVVDLMTVRFLQRRRGTYVLVLDNEMLTFLIALFTRGKKVKLETMYHDFNRYGFFFNRGSRIAIENYLLKLNLLDRKSDSGEAQYVTVVL